MELCRLPVRLPWTSFPTSSMAVTFSCSFRRMAWCMSGMCRDTAHRTRHMQCATDLLIRRQSRGPALRLLVVLGLGSLRDLVVDRMKMMTGVIGHSKDIAVIGGVLILPQRCPAATTQLRTAGPTISRPLSDSFSFVFAHRQHPSAAMSSYFPLAMKLKKSPSGSTMCCATPYLVLPRWCIQNHPNASSRGRRYTGASCRIGRALSEISAECDLSLNLLLIDYLMATQGRGPRRFFGIFPVSSKSRSQLCLSSSAFNWEYWRSAGRTSERPRRPTTALSRTGRTLMAITTGSSFPLSRDAGCRTTSAHDVLLGAQQGHQIRHHHPERRRAHQNLKVVGRPISKRRVHQLE